MVAATSLRVVVMVFAAGCATAPRRAPSTFAPHPRGGQPLQTVLTRAVKGCAAVQDDYSVVLVDRRVCLYANITTVCETGSPCTENPLERLLSVDGQRPRPVSLSISQQSTDRGACGRARVLVTPYAACVPNDDGWFHDQTRTVTLLQRAARTVFDATPPPDVALFRWDLGAGPPPAVVSRPPPPVPSQPPPPVASEPVVAPAPLVTGVPPRDAGVRCDRLWQAAVASPKVRAEVAEQLAKPDVTARANGQFVQGCSARSPDEIACAEQNGFGSCPAMAEVFKAAFAEPAARPTPSPTPYRPQRAVIAPPTEDTRLGFHAGPGLSLGYGFFPDMVFAASLEGHFDLSLGLVNFRFIPRVLLNIGVGPWYGIGGSVLSQVHLNLGRVFSLAAGIDLGVLPTPKAVRAGGSIVLVAPTGGLWLKFGRRSQSNLGLNLTYPLFGQPAHLDLSFAFLF